MKLMLFVLVVFVSFNLFPQDEQLMYTLEGARSKIAKWLQDDLENVSVGGIFEFTSRFTKYSPKLLDLYNKANRKYENEQESINNRIQSQSGIDAIDIYYDFVNNPYSAEQKYINKYFNITGVVSKIERDRYGDWYLLLSARFKCVFSPSRKDQLDGLNLGYSCVLRGKISDYISSNYDKLILVTDCNLVQQSSFSSAKSTMWKNLENYLRNYHAVLDQMIKQMYVELLNNSNNLVHKYIAEGKKNLAILELQKIGKIEGSDRNVKEKILRLEKEIQIDKGIEFMSEDKYKDAYQIFEKLLYPTPFENARELYDKSFSSHILKMAEKVKSGDSIKEYIEIFRMIENNKILNQTYRDSLIADLIPDFEKFAQKFYRGNFEKYVIIPEGEIYRETTGDKLKLNSFLVSQFEIDMYLIWSFEIISNIKIKDSFRLTIAEIPKYEIEKITKWLNVSLINSDQLDFIKAQGWRSLAERNRFLSKSNNYGVKPSELLLTTDIANVDDHLLKNELNDLAIKAKDKINDKIELEKSIAFNTGKVAREYYFISIPNALVNYSWSNWYLPLPQPYHQDIKIASSNASYSLGFIAGLNFGAARISTESTSRFRQIEFIGLGFNYSGNIGFNIDKYTGIAEEENLSVSDYKIQGFEVEAIYSKLFFASLGFANFNNSFNYRAEKSDSSFSGSHSETFQAISVSLGARWSWLAVTLKSYFSLSNNSVYSLDGGLNLFLGLQTGYPFELFERDILVY